MLMDADESDHLLVRWLVNDRLHRSEAASQALDRRVLDVVPKG